AHHLRQGFLVQPGLLDPFLEGVLVVALLAVQPRLERLPQGHQDQSPEDDGRRQAADVTPDTTGVSCRHKPLPPPPCRRRSRSGWARIAPTACPASRSAPRG